MKQLGFTAHYQATAVLTGQPALAFDPASGPIRGAVPAPDGQPTDGMSWVSTCPSNPMEHP